MIHASLLYCNTGLNRLFYPARPIASHAPIFPMAFLNRCLSTPSLPSSRLPCLPLPAPLKGPATEDAKTSVAVVGVTVTSEGVEGAAVAGATV
jgi:hypothetical protein